ncbi:MAG: hypothetical protein KAR31_00690, partial [Candidatus Omnitrophica bacterium]|nr:hypothetical protein [Candidatus Omnitrophota bacterium]
KTTGKKIGARLLSVAVTNTPYLEGMQPLFLKEDNLKKENDMDELLKMLGLKEGATETEIITAVNALKAPVNKALGLKEDASADEAVGAITALCEPINKALGLKEDAGSDEAVTAIKALSDKKGDPPAVAGEILTALELSETATVTDVTAKITDLKKDPDKKLELEVRTLTEKIALSEAKELVDKYAKLGKLVPATREFDLKDAVRDPKEFTERMEKSPVIVTPGSVETKTDDPKTLSEDQQSVNAMMDISKESYEKYSE